MADGQVRIIIDTNADAAAKALDNTQKAFDKTGKSAKTVSSVFNGLQQELNENIADMKELALAGAEDSEGFKRLAANARELKNWLDEANKSVENATNGYNKQKGGMNSLVGAAKGLVAGYLSIQTAKRTLDFALESVEAYRTQERAINGLNIALKNAGVYTDQYAQHLKELASKIQSYSNYGDEAVLKAQGIAQAFMGQVRITDQLTKAVVDFAAAMDMDLEQAFTLVGKSIGSDTNALSRYGVELKKGMTDSEKMAAITKQLSERYQGQAAIMVDANKQLKNSIGDMKEAFGGALNGYVTRWQEGMRIMVEATTKFINRLHALKGDIYALDMQQLTQRYQSNAQVIARMEGQSYYDKGGGLQMKVARKYEQQQILFQMRMLRQQNKATSIAPVKFNDGDINTSMPSISGGSGRSNITKIKQVTDDYQKLQQAVAAARREVELAAIKYGTSSEEVRQKFAKFKQETEKLQAIDSIFDVKKIEQPKTKFEELNQKITETKQRLQELYLTEGANSENFAIAKNELVGLQTQVQDMNTAITSRIGLDWQNISQSIKSNLASALLTPLQQGESAFQRLGSIGLSIVQMIGQEIIKSMLEQIHLQTILKSLGSFFTAFSLFGGGAGAAAGGGAMAIAGVAAANGQVFKNGNVIPFAKGGIVNKPTIFPMANGGTGLMGEAGAEAVMPLRRMSNGKLGVEASDSNNAVQVNIYNQSGAAVETRKRDNGSLDVIIKQVNEALKNERTSSGFRAAYQREDRKGLQAV